MFGNFVKRPNEYVRWFCGSFPSREPVGNSKGEKKTLLKEKSKREWVRYRANGPADVRTRWGPGGRALDLFYPYDRSIGARSVRWVRTFFRAPSLQRRLNGLTLARKSLSVPLLCR